MDKYNVDMNIQSPLRSANSRFAAALIGFAALLATAACTQSDLPQEETAVQPDAPVTLTATLAPATPNETRAATASTPADMPAVGEILEATAIHSHIFLPALIGYTGTMQQAKSLISGTALSTNLGLVSPTAVGADKQLYMKHLELNTTKTTAGLVLMPATATGGSITDLLYANTASTTAGKAATYAFAMKRAFTKISVLVVEANAPTTAITSVTKMEIVGLPHVDETTANTSITPNATDGKHGHCIIKRKYNAANKMLAKAFAKPAAWSKGNLWNAIVPPYYSNDASLVLTNTSGTTLAGGIDISTAVLKITLAANASDNMLAHTYSLPLSSITIPTITDANDPRYTNKTLNYTLTGEHILITVKIDPKVLIEGAAEIGRWQGATATGDIGNPDTPHVRN
jgi:hypothetical protein